MEPASSIAGKTILVTGGTGSFGKKFTEIVLRDHDPEVIRVYSRDELKQLQMREQITDDRLRFFIGDVRDKERLYRALYGVDIVVHAAALKQVPAAEYNPIEAVKTNINGTANAVDASIDNGVAKVVFISTDKAVRPINLYGATKLVAEKLFIQANAYAGGRNTRLSCVRYGNVVGSRGSVVHAFLEQRSNGAIRLTDERMTRFWITLEQGVSLVVQSIEHMSGGEIFIPKIPSMSLVDIARTLAPDAKWEVIGIRPGEKLHEELITEEEARYTREFEQFYIVGPQQPFWNTATMTVGGVPVASDFSFRSDTNNWWLPYADWAKLKAHADEVGMLFFSTPDSPESIDFLAEIGSPCIKIAGGDMNNYPLIRHAALTGLPILLDTRGTLAELEQAINTCVHANNDQIVIVHCPSGYPSPLDSVRLNMVPLYLNTFHYPVGFSDHSPDIDMNIAALCLGAHFIEKTITLDRKIQSVEHVMSLELGEMAAFVQRLRDVEHALGSPWTWSMSSEEKEALKKTRRSVVLTSDSKEGETITAGMIDYKRPGYSISPEMTNMIIGKRLKKDKPADVPLDWEDLSDAV